MLNTSKWDLNDIISFLITGALTGVAIYVANLSIRTENYFLMAISMGALGGLVHEFAQSGGKILFFKKGEDGFYLGSLAGMILGMTAAILMIKGRLAVLESPTMDVDVYDLSIDFFMAGLGLKGVAEAASGHIVKSNQGNKEKQP